MKRQCSETDTKASFLNSAKKQKQSKDEEEVSSSSIITSNNASDLAKTVGESLMKKFGINFDSFLKLLPEGPPLGKTTLFPQTTIDNFFLKIERREKEKVGKKYSCAPINSQLFSDLFFENDSIKWKDGKSSMMPSGIVTQEESITKEIPEYKLKIDNEENLLYYYMNAILLDKLKSDLVVKLLSSLSEFKEMEIFRIEAKELVTDFSKDCLKVLMLSLRQSLVLMDVLYKKTGYIYPILAPSMQNAGCLYRLSTTSILPSAIFYYLRVKNGLVKNDLGNSILFHTVKLADNLKLCEHLKQTNTDENSFEENEEPLLKQKLLTDFFPEFIRDEKVSIDSSAVFANSSIQCSGGEVEVFKVSTKSDVEKLIHFCLCTVNYIIDLFKMIHREMNLEELQFESKEFTHLEGIKFNRDLLEYRFKLISNTRSKVYIVERFNGNSWEPFEVLKEFVGDLAVTILPYEKEISMNGLVANYDC